MPAVIELDTLEATEVIKDPSLRDLSLKILCDALIAKSSKEATYKPHWSETPYTDTLKIPSQKTVRVSLDPADGRVFKQGYYRVLGYASANHYPVVFSPSIFWQMVLGEIASHVVDNAEHYEVAFADPLADKGQKTEISVPTDDPQVLPIGLVVDELRRLCPTPVGDFLPELSTGTPESMFAHQSSFLEMVSPYYDYMMYLCGIPAVRVEGTLDDWKLVRSKLAWMLSTLPVMPDLAQYLHRADKVAEQVHDSVRSHESNVEVVSTSDSEFWRKMFYEERCGSGSDTEMKGWITDLAFKYPSLGKVQNFPAAISKVPYTLLDTGQTFTLHAGIIAVTQDDGGFLVPDFGFVVNEDLTEEYVAESVTAEIARRERPPADQNGSSPQRQDIEVVPADRQNPDNPAMKLGWTIKESVGEVRVSASAIEKLNLHKEDDKKD
jgi:hypothetical protein